MARDRVILIVGLVRGGATVHDGEYLVEYDPSRGNTPREVHLVTTPDIQKAKRMTFEEAHATWSAVDKRQPRRRPDWKPNRPLTAYTIEIKKVT